VYGRPDARFTLIEYADLECPYCREYFPLLRRWIDAHPDVNWRWHHLPLSIHDPAATREARLAECAGETEGNTAFWNAVAWIYQHTRGGGRGLPEDATLPNPSPALRDCVNRTRPDDSIRAQASEAGRERITSTPTLRLLDRATGKSLTVQGLIEGDAILSAFDLLVAPPTQSPRTHPIGERER
jgi:protein-disulfide isomerase